MPKRSMPKPKRDSDPAQQLADGLAAFAAKVQPTLAQPGEAEAPLEDALAFALYIESFAWRRRAASYAKAGDAEGAEAGAYYAHVLAALGALLKHDLASGTDGLAASAKILERLVSLRGRADFKALWRDSGQAEPRLGKV